MFSKRTEPRSIASQLVLLFTAAAVFLLSCGLGVLYLIVVRHTFEEDNAFLADKTAAIRADLDKEDWSKRLSERVVASQVGERPGYWIRVVDKEGNTVNETPGMNGLLPANVFPGVANASAITPADYRMGGRLFSLVAIQQEIGGQPYTLQVAQDRSRDEEFTRAFGTLLVVVLAFGILASAVIAIIVTKRGLRPLAEMTGSLKRIGPTHLSERVAPDRWPRELQPLAVAFDEMLDRLEDSFTRLSQFSADLAHELRTPVANILGASQVSLIRSRNADEYREVIESSVAECERLSAIIDNLLFLARAEGAREQIKPSLLNGGAEVEKIVAFHEAIAEEQHITITCTGEGEIYADPILFGRAISNLVENALRFTPAGGTIEISIVSGPGGSTVSVRDTGSGIAAEHIPRVFDRFYRVDPSRSAQGTGLGLALVKSIVDLHGGSVAVESEVTRGTRVILTFPDGGGSGPTA